MAKEIKIYGYKIRNKITGKYLASSGRWTSVGKVYARKGGAINKLNQLLKQAPKSLGGPGKGYYRASSVKTKDKLLEEILQCEIVELCEANSYPITFELDKIKV